MHVTSGKVMTVGAGVLTLCLGLPFLAQAESSHDSTDYKYRSDSDQRDWSNSRRGNNANRDRYSQDWPYYTDQYGDLDTMQDQGKGPSDRSGGTWTEGGYRSSGSSAPRDRSRGEYSRSDAKIERNITDNIRENSRNVQVDVRNGVAILTGTVQDRDEMKAAIEKAYDGGAQKVVNHMEVARLEDRKGENRGDTGLARGGDTGLARGGDTGLARAVQNELAKNRSVNNDRIWVTANEGTVILEGTVEDRSEMGAAVRDAYEAGARRVDNRLRVVH